MPFSENFASQILEKLNADAIFVHDVLGNVQSLFFRSEEPGGSASSEIGVVLSVAEELAKKLELGKHQYTVLSCSGGDLFITSVGNRILSIFSKAKISEPEEFFQKLVSTLKIQ